MDGDHVAAGGLHRHTDDERLDFTSGFGHEANPRGGDLALTRRRNDGILDDRRGGGFSVPDLADVAPGQDAEHHE